LLHFYPRLSHRELRRAQAVLEGRGGGRPDTAIGANRKSIHRLCQRSDPEWFAWFADILECCGQARLAGEMRGEAGTGGRRRARRAGGAMPVHAGIGRVAAGLLTAGRMPNIPALREFRYFRHLARNLIAPAYRRRLRKMRDAVLASHERLSGGAGHRRAMPNRPAPTPPDIRP
jgi:hypothetical protein